MTDAPKAAHVYEVRKPCGCLVALSVDSPALAKDIGKMAKNAAAKGYPMVRIPIAECTTGVWRCDAHKPACDLFASDEVKP